jgi:hypothetical protein
MLFRVPYSALQPMAKFGTISGLKNASTKRKVLKELVRTTVLSLEEYVKYLESINYGLRITAMYTNREWRYAA